MSFNVQAAIDAAFADADAEIAALNARIVDLEHQAELLLAVADRAGAERDAARADLLAAQQTIVALQARIAELEGGTPAPEPEPQPEPQPEPEPQPPADSFWQGLNTVWPNASTTGPRIPLTATTNNRPSGTVKGKKFTGTVWPAEGTVFEDCEFNGGGIWMVDADGKRCTFRYCRFIGKGAYGAGILGTPLAEYCDFSGMQDGIKTMGDGWVIRRCYFHDPASSHKDPHYDGIAIQWDNSNGLIEENYIDWKDTSAIFMKNETGQISNITVRHNWLGGADLPMRIEDNIPGCKVIENVIEKGGWGHMDIESPAEVRGNIDSVTGKAL